MVREGSLASTPCTYAFLHVIVHNQVLQFNFKTYKLLLFDTKNNFNDERNRRIY